MALDGLIVAFGAPSATDPNDIATNYYGVADGTGVLSVDGANNAEVLDQATFFPDDETGQVLARELKATLQQQQPDRIFMTLKVSRETSVTYPTGLTPAIEP